MRRMLSSESRLFFVTFTNSLEASTNRTALSVLFFFSSIISTEIVTFKNRLEGS